MANSADQISWFLQKPTDLDLYCLQRQGISGFSRTKVNFSMKTYIVDSHWNHITVVIPVRIHNINFHGEREKYPYFLVKKKSIFSTAKQKMMCKYNMTISKYLQLHKMVF